MGHRAVPCSVEDIEKYRREQTQGHESIPGGRTPPGPTRETSRPFTETAQRKPYIPVADLREPTLDEGVSFRQKL